MKADHWPNGEALFYFIDSSKPPLYKKTTMWRAFLTGVVMTVALCAAFRATLRWRRHILSAVGIEHRVLGAGRAWSEAQYPEQYDPVNWTHATMCPVERHDPEFLQNQRFMDIGGRTYSEAFSRRFSYAPNAEGHPTVKLSYLRRAETFVGNIVAEGLKPNFAYQVKLVGNRDDRTAFEAVGRLGRWKLPIDNTNISDRQYARYPNKHAAASYLFFDFIVTDEQGRAAKTLYADSSLHVLFNADHQRAPRHGDSAPIERRLVRPAELYANPHAHAGSVRLYAETESGSASGNRRPAIGAAFLSPGTYRLSLELTEESFHQFGDGGLWTTVLQAPVTFEVTSARRPPSSRWRWFR